LQSIELIIYIIMGNCCSGSNNDAEVNMMQGNAHGAAPAQYF